MRREYHAWHSDRVGRRMELILYGDGGDPVLLFPTSFGNMLQNEDFGLVGAIADRIDWGRYTVACVNGLDRATWYNKSIHPADRVRFASAYESYIFAEVLPLLWSRTGYRRELTFGGCSFGAFHALNMALRHPATVDKVLAMSGKFDTAGFLDGYYDDNVFYHTAKDWLPGLRDPYILEKLHGMNIILAAGEHDICRGAAEEMSGILWSKGIGNHLSLWDGAQHDWPVWRRMIRHYMA